MQKIHKFKNPFDNQPILKLKNNIEIKENNVFNGKQIIYFTDNKIVASLNLDTLIILVLAHSDNNQNVICLNRQGHIVWTIEKREYPNLECTVNNIYIENGKCLLYRWCGIEEEIDPQTGTILRSELIR